MKFEKCRYPICFVDDTYPDRRKDEAYRLLRNRADETAPLLGAIALLDSQFQRSLLQARRERRVTQHPEFGPYVQMRDLDNMKISADAQRYLRVVYGRPILGVMPPGDSYFTRESTARAKALTEGERKRLAEESPRRWASGRRRA